MWIPDRPQRPEEDDYQDWLDSLPECPDCGGNGSVEDEHGMEHTCRRCDGFGSELPDESS
jgi:DnaJ-class molecular chaperone